MNLPKLEGGSLRNWYVAQLHELTTKCLDGLSPRWNQTETSFSYDDILTMNSMCYVDKENDVRFDSNKFGFKKHQVNQTLFLNLHTIDII